MGPPTNSSTCKVTGLVALPDAALNVTVPEYAPDASVAVFTDTFTVADPLPDAGLTDNHDPPDLVVTFVDHPSVVEPTTARLTD